MATIKVYGFVGTDAFPIALSELERRTLVKQLRNYIETRIEAQFDAWTNLSISEAGSVFVVADGDQDESMNSSLRKFADQCVMDFCAAPQKYGPQNLAARFPTVQNLHHGGIFG